jgi:hypothetical protein
MNLIQHEAIVNPACHSHSKRTTCGLPWAAGFIARHCRKGEGGTRRCKGKHSLSKKAWPGLGAKKEDATAS